MWAARERRLRVGGGEGEKVAIKKISNCFVQATEAKRILRELRILRHLSHANIIRIRDVLDPCSEANFTDLWVVFDFVDLDLRKLIASPQNISVAHVQWISHQILAALQYLRKLCSHPRLVTPPDDKNKSKSKSAGAGLGARVAEAYSPKFRALKQILLDCGVGVDKVVTEPDPEGEFRTAAGGGAGHRVLIFSQLKSVLDLVEDELLGPAGELGGVSWLRLDGGVAPTARFEVVRKFNADPSIDVLLLTTHVGGLGLNLTSADTVVFLEHDWNPQKDLQAMDRAHRLGQKRTVNVFRLLTKGTLEEKVMSLQRFKLDVANAVVNSDNMSLAAMDTGQMLELFTAEKGAAGGASDERRNAPASGAGAAAADAVAGGLKQALTGLDELWDESQYKEEFALDGFINSLNK